MQKQDDQENKKEKEGRHDLPDKSILDSSAQQDF